MLLKGKIFLALIKIIDRLATKLIEKETLDLNAIIEILGNRPFEAKANFKAYLETKKS